VTLSPSATWRFLDSGWASGPRHMAIDHALLTLHREERSPPTLRLYSFRPACLSLGRFQDARPYAEGYRSGLQIVRRPTGGGAVLHRGDICYSIIAPIDEPLVVGSIRQSYQKIAAALAQGLALLGLPPLRQAPTRHSLPPAGWCFDAVAPHELTLDGAKLVGSAQVRRDGALLQQGSIRLAPAEGQPAGVTSVEEALGRRVRRREIAKALVQGFAQAWAVDFRDSGLSPREEELARRLEREKYRAAGWTWEIAPQAAAARIDVR
jgi:lipoate-protein ligase A